MNADFENSGFSGLAHGGLDFFLCFLDHLLDPRGMDPAVGDQFLQGNAGHFPSDRIKSGQDDCLRRIVDDELHTRQLLQRADVPAFAADDAALHFVVRKLYNGNRSLGDAVRRASLDRADDILAGLLVRLISGLCFKILDQLCCIMFDIISYRLQQELLGLIRGKAGDPLQFCDSFVIKRIHLAGPFGDLLLSGLQLCFFLFERRLFPVEILFPAQHAVLIMLQLSSSLFGLSLQLILRP